MSGIGVDQTWYFLHADRVSTEFRSHVAWQQDDHWLVSLWAQIEDFLWQTMESLRVDDAYLQSIADAYLTAVGCRGRLAQLCTADTPMVMITHWLSLFSNGRRTGPRILNEVCRRLQVSFGEQVQWTHCSELARSIAAQDSPRQVVF
jgi:hypothetical protein